jgi:hypothetical protein
VSDATFLGRRFTETPTKRESSEGISIRVIAVQLKSFLRQNFAAQAVDLHLGGVVGAGFHQVQKPDGMTFARR